jgi:hypothetical protein
MTKEEFDIFWISGFPGSLPIPHHINYDNENWFRIHSLPGSKRYAETEEEWSILLSRHNEIITDILGDDASILFITGEYSFEGGIELHPMQSANSIASLSFISLPAIDLHEIMPEYYDKGQYFHPVFCEEVWRPGKFDHLLRDIAEDNLRGFFISITNKFIIAPYDGGMDIILDNPDTRDRFKDKYSSWLSTRPDGL